MQDIGFDEPCLAFYDGKGSDQIYFNNIRNASGDYKPFVKSDRLKWFGAPLYQEAFRWFREKNMWAEVKVEDSVKIGTQKFYWLIFGEYKSLEGSGWIRALKDSNDVYYTTYEEAELACLRKLIEIAKEKL